MKPFFRKYLDNNCTADEFRSLIDFFVKPEHQQELETNMHEDWKDGRELDSPGLKRTLQRVHDEINRQQPLMPQSRRLMTYLTRVAALLFIPLAIAYLIQLQQSEQASAIMQTISTPLASKTDFELPDGSHVWLNSGSSVSFAKSFDGKTRRVKLNGEAYFDVKKTERPFQVETAHVTIDVLGTAFNVMAYDHEQPAVTLERGKITLKTSANQEETLAPGQQAVIDTLSHAIQLQQVETNLYSAWIRNQLIFKNAPLGHVTSRLERWYNIDIRINDPSLMDIQMTATIEMESVGEIMELMDLTLPVSYRYDKNKRELTIFHEPKN